MDGATYKILEIDPYLEPYKSDIEARMRRYESTKKQILGDEESLSSFASGHLYFGLHRVRGGWCYREWAPGADGMALIGDFNGWDRTSHPMKKNSDGVWEIMIKGKDALPHGSKVKVEVRSRGRILDRIPLYIRRVVQDPGSKAFDGQVWNPEKSYVWKNKRFDPADIGAPLIYESHVGMASSDPKVTTYREYTEFLLPRVKALGYNAIQLMAIMEHPYYGSFGYQVSNFFAASSRFGTPEELKELVDTAHGMGIAVIMDIVHSHAASNALEGIAEFDGTDCQFFHQGPRGSHLAWGTKLFNYAKPEVLHFLLSNLKFWLEEYRFDGFRFDGVTSMLYHDHGLGGVFDNYGKYFSLNTDVEAVTYLQLAAALCKELKPGLILISEDMSGMPGMCLPLSFGGVGFDYRLGMGTPDFWIRTLKERPDEHWNMGQLWHELSQRRPQEKVVGYCESHDQALVGDKTIMFWLADKEMYWHMDKEPNLIIDRAMALHKMIRLITCTCAGEGYLNFMGNEFGHPEWIDFPREENGWSYHYARRRWDLADNPELRYQFLQRFDQAMIGMAREHGLLAHPSKLIYHSEQQKILVYRKNRHLFLFNFHPNSDCRTPISLDGDAEYRQVLHTNWKEFGGYNDSGPQSLVAKSNIGHPKLEVFIEKRSAMVFEEANG